MDTVKRAVGALLLLTAALIGTYSVVSQLNMLPFLWAQLNYLMGLSTALGVAFAYIRKRRLESAGLDRIITRRYLEANILFYGFLIIAMLFFSNWFDSLFDTEPQGVHRTIIGILLNAIAPLFWGALGIFLLRGGNDD